MKKSLIGALSVLLLASLAACSTSSPVPQPTVPVPVTDSAPPMPSDDVAITGDDNGSSVDASVGETISLTLADNPSTGYTWQALTEPDTAVLRSTGTHYTGPEQQIPGAGGERTWTFEAIGPGTATISLASVPPGEKVKPSMKAFEVTINVNTDA